MFFILCLSLMRTVGGLWSLYGLQGLLLRRKHICWPQVASFEGQHHPKSAQCIWASVLCFFSQIIWTTLPVTSNEWWCQNTVGFPLYLIDQWISCHKGHTMSHWPLLARLKHKHYTFLHFCQALYLEAKCRHRFCVGGAIRWRDNGWPSEV